MGREVPFIFDQVCADCGDPATYDFMGDFLCGPCSSNLLAEMLREAYEDELAELENQEIERNFRANPHG